MKIKVNGKKREINALLISIVELLMLEKIENPEMVSVQLNGEFVEKEKLSATYLKESDEIEFIYFMGGGSVRVVLGSRI